MNNQIIVTDNIMPPTALISFLNKISSSNFPWYYSPVVGADVDIIDEGFNFQFAHTLYDRNVPRNEWFNSVSFILDFIPNLHSLVKFKVNFNPRYSSVIEHTYHVDVPFECKTSVLYLNTNDGYTLFETGEKIQSVENRLVTFPSQLLHTGTTCTDQKGRFVVNINYF